jgi:hypothetical protein
MSIMEPRDPTQDGFDIRDNPLLDLFFGAETAMTTAATTASDAVVPVGVKGTTATDKGRQNKDAPMSAAFTLATFNIRNTPRMPQPQVERCGKILSKTFDIGNAQEIDTPQIESWFHKGLGPSYTTLGASDNPSYYTDAFTIQKHGSIVLSDAIHLPGFDNPPRSFNWAEVQHNQSGILFMFIGTHLINGAWNDKNKPYKQLRKDRWTAEFNTLQRYCVAMAETLPTFVVGDLNRFSPVPKFVPRMEWLANHTDDHIGYISPAKPKQGTVTLTVGSEKHIKDPSDHLAVTLDIKIQVKP